MGMYHSSSGKHKYDYNYVKTSFTLPKEVLKQVLINEDKLRASPEYQSKYNENDNLSWFEQVTTDIQLQALRECGVTDLTNGLFVLRNARVEFKDDPEMNQLTVYMREDRSRLGDLRENMPVPNVPLQTLDGETVMLKDYYDSLQRSDFPPRPLIIVAGSVSWPPLRQSVPLMNGWLSEYSDSVDFLMVYIDEAHASDKWPLGHFVDIPNHQTIQERTQAAKMLVSNYDFKLPVLLDTMENLFDKNFAVWPERYFIIKDGMVNFIAGPTSEYGYDRYVLNKMIQTASLSHKEEEEDD